MTKRERACIHRYRSYWRKAYGVGAMKHLDLEPPERGSAWDECIVTDAKMHRARSVRSTR